MNGKVKPVNVADAVSIQAIYAPYVRNTSISFETKVPDVGEIRERIAAVSESYPWFVYECENEILGYAYASQHRTREAYRWSVDTAVYVREGFARRGIGRELYRILLKELELAKFANAFAGITLPNEGSVALHESMGFVHIGVYRDVGFKHGKWLDVAWWQKSFPKYECPSEPTYCLTKIPL